MKEALKDTLAVVALVGAIVAAHVIPALAFPAERDIISITVEPISLAEVIELKRVAPLPIADSFAPSSASDGIVIESDRS